MPSDQTTRPAPRGWRLLGPSHAVPWRRYKRIMRRHRWHLTPHESAVFWDAMLTPREPSAKLREAAQRAKEMFGG